MRFSEVLALSWDDIDFAAGVIHVRHQLARGRRGVPPRRVAPKTRASLREIPLAPQLAAVLKDHKRDSRFAADADYVFATRNGTPLLHRNVARRTFTRAVLDSGLAATRDRRVRFHDLRHTFASHLIIDVRLDVAQVSRILGHARTSITLDTYTHLFEQAAHGADVRAQLARSELAMVLAHTAEPTAHASTSSPDGFVCRPRDRRLRPGLAARRFGPPAQIAPAARRRSGQPRRSDCRNDGG